MDIENTKQRVLDMVGDIVEIDFTKTPSFFFLGRLREEMKERGLHDWTDTALGGIDVDFSALGIDYGPHEEWLSEMAKVYVKVVEKLITTFQTFGEDVVRKQLSNLYIKME